MSFLPFLKPTFAPLLHHLLFFLSCILIPSCHFLAFPPSIAFFFFSPNGASKCPSFLLDSNNEATIHAISFLFKKSPSYLGPCVPITDLTLYLQQVSPPPLPPSLLPLIQSKLSIIRRAEMSEGRRAPPRRFSGAFDTFLPILMATKSREECKAPAPQRQPSRPRSPTSSSARHGPYPHEK